MFFGVGEDAGYGGGEFAIGDDAAGFAVADDGAWAAVGGDDGGDSAGEGLKDYVAEGVSVRGEDEEVHVGVGGGEGFAFEDSGELGAGQALAEPGFFAAVADDEEAEAFVADSHPSDEDLSPGTPADALALWT